MRSEKRKAQSEKPKADCGFRRFSMFVFRFSFLPLLAAGCASDKGPTTRPSSIRDRQDAALQDPFGYSPNMDKDSPDVSGGDLGHLDRDAMKKDIDHVLNP